MSRSDEEPLRQAVGDQREAEERGRLTGPVLREGQGECGAVEDQVNGERRHDERRANVRPVRTAPLGNQNPA